MVSIEAPWDHGTLQEKADPALAQFSSVFPTFYMQRSSNIHSIKYLSSGLQGSKNVFHLDFSLHHFTGYNQSSALLTGKFLGFSSLFCMEVISTLITPDYLFHLHYRGFEILTSVADFRLHVLCASNTHTAVQVQSPGTSTVTS